MGQPQPQPKQLNNLRIFNSLILTFLFIYSFSSVPIASGLKCYSCGKDSSTHPHCGDESKAFDSSLLEECSPLTTKKRIRGCLTEMNYWKDGQVEPKRGCTTLEADHKGSFENISNPEYEDHPQPLYYTIFYCTTDKCNGPIHHTALSSRSASDSQNSGDTNTNGSDGQAKSVASFHPRTIYPLVISLSAISIFFGKSRLI